MGLCFVFVSLPAKEKLCFCETTECNPIHCPYAKGHYDRINDAVFLMLTQKNTFSREVIEEYAKKYQVCPFEMSLDVSLWCDAIICDYNYVFDPNVALKRFFSEGAKGEYLFLVDEAHNLVERGREMYSAFLYKEDFLRLKNEVKFYSRKLEKNLEKCNKNLLELKRECETYQVIDSIGAFVLNLMSLASEIEKFLEENDEKDIRDKVLEFYFQVRHFLSMYERLDDNYVIYTEHDQT
ncbi:helicase, partial [Lachnotalea glycerini]